MRTISVCMIVKNEEDVIARCLDCAKRFADEIVVVDTGSSDRTKEIALSYTDKVYDFPWIDDFAAARNFAFSKGAMDYLMWLDADDVVSPDGIAAINKLKEELEGIDMVMMRYHTGFDAEGNPTYSYYRERLMRREANYRWIGAVHECVAPTGNIVYKDIAILHQKLRPSDPDRNLRIFERLLAQGNVLDPRQQFYYARELYYHQRYQEAICVLDKFLEDKMGWIENNIEACSLLSQCYDALGEKQNALLSLYRSFAYDAPRAEICCGIGGHFLGENLLRQAAFWYEAALRCERDDRGGGFVQPDAYGYLPAIELCVIYDRLGNREKAIAYNEKAASYKSDDPSVLFNRSYFSQTARE